MQISIILLFLIWLTACNSSDKNAGQVTVADTTQTTTRQQTTAVSSVYVLDTITSLDFSGDTTEQINKTLKLISEFDRDSANFHRDTFSVYKETTEGCEIIVVNGRTTEHIKLYGTLYGEMGKSEFQFYMLNKQHPKLSCAIFTDISYDKPMYEKDMKIKETKTTYQIYSDNKLISVLDRRKNKQDLSSKKLKEMENETRQFFNVYIGQIKIVK